MSDTLNTNETKTNNGDDINNKNIVTKTNIGDYINNNNVTLTNCVNMIYTEKLKEWIDCDVGADGDARM
jgi:hypothetical protein